MGASKTDILLLVWPLCQMLEAIVAHESISELFYS